MQQSYTLSKPVKLFLLIIGLVFLTREMQNISSILITFIFSFFAALIFAPLVHWLQRKRVPTILSVGVVVFLFILIIAVLGIVIAVTITQLSGRIPAYETELTGYMESLTQYLPSTEELSLNMVLREFGGSVISISMGFLNGVINATTTVVLIIIITAFLLMDAAGTPKPIQKELEDEFVLLAKLHAFSKVVVDYVRVRTEANLITGGGVAVALLIGGIEFAIFWGIVMFIFSYIPYIGLFLASIPPALLALLQYGPIGALAVITVILIINMLAEDVLLPSLAGRDLELSPSVVLLSIIYWVYVLGPAGALIATPLTISIKIILESFEETEEIARLMNSKKAREKEKQSKEQEA
ncbi:AI-2E family transporter [Methanolobus sp.]|uniref:AI-2E family transporter n=1 Tax=Methanolobus sp. TaxID=1874737 RepID=UPI0025DE1019|nr:AI-2E family transporter [Methanolobus sp.]